MRYKTAPYKHQTTALSRSQVKTAYALFMEMGTGKSKIIIDNAYYLTRLASAKWIEALIIITPNGLQQNWVLREIPTHLLSNIKYSAAYYHSGMPKALKQQWDAMFDPDLKGLRILAINYEQLLVTSMFARLVRFMREYPTMLVLDESQCIKSPKAARTKRAWQLGTFALYRRILSGTPITQSPLDLWAQFKFLDKTILDFHSYTAFKHTYASVQRVIANNKWGFYEHVTGYRRLPDLRKRIAPYTFAIRKTECLDLPPKIFENVYVQLTDQQKRMYKDLRRDAMAELEITDKNYMVEDVLAEFLMNENKVSASNALTKTLRMQQVLGGFVKDDSGAIQALENNRIKALLSILEDAPLDTKVIIWAKYRSELAEIVKTIIKKFGIKSVVEYHGGVSAKNRTIAVDSFQNYIPARFFVGQPGAGGRGLTLTAATIVIWYSIGYSLEHYLQANDRPHRIGQKHAVTYIHLLAPKTLDEAILKILNTKRKLAQEVI